MSFEQQELIRPVCEVGIQKIHTNKKLQDQVSVETPVALVYNGISHVVMMCSPKQLKEFAVGFSISEGIVPDPTHIYDVSVKKGCRDGLVVDLEISPRSFWALKDQRRNMAGRTGCGICGTENLEKVYKSVKPLPVSYAFDLAFYHKGMEKLNEIQEIGQVTGSMHSVVALNDKGEFLGGAEDVSRHIAMDKVIGMMKLNGWTNVTLFISSRASFEMVQKAAMAGVEILFAVSAPTLNAIEVAERANITLAAFCRQKSANLYTHPERLVGSIPEI